MIKNLINRIAQSQLRRDVSYVFLGQIAIMLSVFGINKIISYYMGVESFALYSLIKRAGGMVACITTGGMAIALPRYIARFSGTTTIDKVFVCHFLDGSIKIVSFYSIFIVFITILFPETFIAIFFDKINLNILIVISSLVFAVGQSYSNLLFAYYQGYGNFKAYNIVQCICSLFCLVVAFVFKQNLYVIVLISYSALFFIGIIPLLYYKSQLFNKTFQSNKGASKQIKHIIIGKLLRYGTPRLLHDLVLFIQDIIPLTIILHRFNLHAVGLYSAGLSIPLTISPLFAFTGGVFLQRVSILIRQKEWRSINKLINSALVLFLIIAILGTIILIIAKEMVIHIMFADTFNEVLPLVPYFALSLIPRAIYLLYRNPLDAVSEIPYNLYIVSTRTVALVLMLLYAETIVRCAEAYLYSSIVLIVMPLGFWFKLRKK